MLLKTTIKRNLSDSQMKYHLVGSYDRFRAPLLFAVDPCVSIHGFISMDAVSLDSSLFENKL